jgi:hypothetical protein
MKNTHMVRNQRLKESGSVIVAILMVMVFLITILFGLLTVSKANLVRARGRIMLLQAQYAAESGADAGIAMLNSGNTTYTGTTSDVTILNIPQYKATYSVSVAAGSTDKERVLTAVGKVYAPAKVTTPTYTRTIKVWAQRSSTSTASSVVSRNIIEIASGVKNLYAKDIYVNGYIQMDKNTTNLVAENITVAGKNTGASNCSIGGSGNLVKPASFTTAGQTKTNLNLAYNNCLSPPGNTTNTGFNVTANQGGLSQVQSLYIPWGQYMDSTYVNAGNCSDWTTGSGTRNIPSVSGSKQTHYPDSGSNISTSCGNSGDVSLGSNQYNINANVHIRANLCTASACDPTFYNPSASPKYIFVEGTANFNSLTTASGSGPIVLITYGTDPASKAGSCPYGGSLYLGQSGSGSTNAPAMYLLAMNGLCIDKTKFNTSPALGGIGGKNIYVASNPATPRDLALDPNFPVNQIPIDLSWREVRYQRL